MTDEKWVVVTTYDGVGSDWNVSEVHGIFSSEDEAADWGYEEYSEISRVAWVVRRIRKARMDLWA